MLDFTSKAEQMDWGDGKGKYSPICRKMGKTKYNSRWAVLFQLLIFICKMIIVLLTGLISSTKQAKYIQGQMH